MRLTRRVRLQLALFGIIAVTGVLVLLFGYLNAPAAYLGVGRHTVTVQLPEAGGLYDNANVVYRGTTVGRVKHVGLDDGGRVAAVLSLDSAVPIPADLDAAVHSVSSAGEQYLSLTPRSENGASLKDGDVIVDRASVPPDINVLLDATNRGLDAIPPRDLTTVIDESYTAFAGMGPQLSRIVNGSTKLALDARDNLASILTLIDQSKPVLDSQADTADDIQAWSTHLAQLTGSLQRHDSELAEVFQKAGPALDEGKQFFERIRPTLPILTANLASAGRVAVTYQPALEQLLVLLPSDIAGQQGTALPNLTYRGPYKGLYLDLALNVNLPPVCNTGFLPPQQQRAMSEQNYPARPAGDLYCRLPKDAPFNVRGARNYPCLTVPGKRAPTVKMCESNEEYIPLNDGDNWKGDPNATSSGQGVPQLPASAPQAGDAPTPPSVGPAAGPLAIADYDPATGEYVGPDGTVYRQSDLATPTQGDKTLQSMLLPPS